MYLFLYGYCNPYSATRKGGLGPKTKGIGVGKFRAQRKNPEGQSQIKGKVFSYGKN